MSAYCAFRLTRPRADAAVRVCINSCAVNVKDLFFECQREAYMNIVSASEQLRVAADSFKVAATFACARSCALETAMK